MPEETTTIVIACKSRDAVRQVDDFTDAVGRADSSSRNLIASAAALFASSKALQYAKRTVAAFSEMEEAHNRFKITFADVISTANDRMAELRREFGLSEKASYSMLAATGDLLTGFGFSSSAALKLSDSAARLGMDLYSYTNYAGGAEGATMALVAAMLGETEKAKALGIVIRQDSEEYKKLVSAFSGGGLSEAEFSSYFGSGGKEYTQFIAQFKNVKGLTEQQAKAMTAQAIAVRQSKNAIGDWNREGETYAQVLQANAQLSEQFRKNVGEGLVPAFKSFYKAQNSILRGFNDLDPELQSFIVTTGTVTAGLGAAVAVVKLSSAAQTVYNSLTRKGAEEAAAEAKARGLNAAAINQEAAAIAGNNAARSVKHPPIMHMPTNTPWNTGRNAAFREQAPAALNTTGVIAGRKEYKQAFADIGKNSKSHIRQLTAMDKGNLALTASAKKSATGIAMQGKAMAGIKNGALAAVGGIGKLSTAAGSLALSMAPMLAVGVAVAAISHFAGAGARRMEGEINVLGKDADKAKELRLEEEKKASEDQKNARRLEELSGFTQMSSGEQEEAVRIVKDLTDRYGDLGHELDKTNGKLKIGAGAWRKMTEAQQANWADAMQKEIIAAQKKADAALGRATKNDSAGRQGFVQGLGVAGIANYLKEKGIINTLDDNSIDDLLKGKSNEERVKILEGQARMEDKAGNTDAAQRLYEMAKGYKEVIALQEARNKGLKAEKENIRKLSAEAQKYIRNFDRANESMLFQKELSLLGDNPFKQKELIQKKIDGFAVRDKDGALTGGRLKELTARGTDSALSAEERKKYLDMIKQENDTQLDLLQRRYELEKAHFEELRQLQDELVRNAWQFVESAQNAVDANSLDSRRLESRVFVNNGADYQKLISDNAAQMAKELGKTQILLEQMKQTQKETKEALEKVAKFLEKLT